MNPADPIITACPVPVAVDSPALCVDLDGTLVKSDTLLDSILTLIRRDPAATLRCFLFLPQGKAAFKAKIGRHVILDPTALPYNRPLLEYLKAESASGRQIYLATASHEEQAREIAEHLGFFTGVIASDARTNLRDTNKRKALELKFAAHGFDYVGNARPDVAALAGAKTAMLANPSLGLAAQLKRQNVMVQRTFRDRAAPMKAVAMAFRIRQWPKNLLVFAPVLLAHVLLNRHYFILTSLAFVSWCFTASATYIINDLLDVTADRNHPSKRKRPFAAGDLSPQAGVVIVCVLLALSAMIAARLPVRFTFWLVAYFVTTLAYSLVLKRLALVDVITLAGLYTVRMFAGAAVAAVVFSPWLGGFSVFFFLSLAIVKRYAELDNLRKAGRIPTNGRGYRVDDLEQLRSFGTASGYAAAVVFSLYINANPEISQHYAHFERLWFLVPVLVFWISRVWLLAHRGELDEDPVVFAMTDTWSLVLGLVALVIFSIST